MFTEIEKQSHHNTVVERLRSLMVTEGLDALVILKNENFTYVNTVPSAFLSQSGIASLAMIVIPRDKDMFGICCDFEKPAMEREGLVKEWHEFPMWIYIDHQFISGEKGTAPTPKTEFFELNSSLAVLKDRLKSLDLLNGKIGIEFSAVQVPVWEGLQSTLPDVTFIDAGAIYVQARAVKTPYEINCLRHAAGVQEDIVFRTMSEVEVGMSHAEILSRLRSRSLAAKGIDSIRFMFVSIGPLFAP
ncbi:MAG: hypothetical protein GY754_46815, partial [bacterium]|nr:hypothetical protein [bacterium]